MNSKNHEHGQILINAVSKNRLIAIFILLLSLNINAQHNTYYVGHSGFGFSQLNLVGLLVEGLATDAGITTYDYGDQIIGGSCLSTQWEDHAQTTTGDSWVDIPAGNNSGQYDVFVCTELIPIWEALDPNASAWGCNLHPTVALDNFYDMAINANANTRIYMMEFHNEADFTASSDTNVVYNNWASLNASQRPLWEMVADSVSALNPTGPQVCLIPVASAAQAMVDSIMAGVFPGIYSFVDFFEPFDGDSWKIHNTDITCYLTACVHFATIFGQSPVGLTNIAAPGFSVMDGSAPSTAQALMMQQIAWEIVSNDPRACIPTSFSASVSATNYSCGNCDATATVTATSGITPYTYSWNDPASQTNATAVGLCGGSFSVVVSDASGDSDTLSITVTGSQNVVGSVGSVSNASCAGFCDGELSASAVSGTAPYSYMWNDTGNQTNATATGLCAGNYTVTITDANGCTDTDGFPITQPTALSLGITGTDVLCNLGTDGDINLTVSGGTPSYSFLWSNSMITEDIMGLSAGTYTVTLTDANGCQEMSTQVIEQPSAIALSGSSTDANCGQADGSVSILATGGVGSYIYAWDDASLSTDSAVSNLEAGIYNVSVTDYNGCLVTDNVMVNNIGGGSAFITDSNPVDCFGNATGDATVSVVGGTAPFTYGWNDPSSQLSAQATGLIAGTYLATVADAAGCLAFANVTITEPNSIGVISSVTDATNSNDDGAVDVTVTGGTSPYTFSWSSGETSEDLVSKSTGIYLLTVIDANGCEQMHSAEIQMISGISTVNKIHDLTMFPNPASDVLYLRSDVVFKDLYLEAFDLLGKRVLGVPVALNEEVQLLSLAPGVYVIHIRQDNKTVLLKKLVIQ